MKNNRRVPEPKRQNRIRRYLRHREDVVRDLRKQYMEENLEQKQQKLIDKMKKIDFNNSLFLDMEDAVYLFYYDIFNHEDLNFPLLQQPEVSDEYETLKNNTRFLEDMASAYEDAMLIEEVYGSDSDWEQEAWDFKFGSYPDWAVETFIEDVAWRVRLNEIHAYNVRKNRFTVFNVDPNPFRDMVDIVRKTNTRLGAIYEAKLGKPIWRMDEKEKAGLYTYSEEAKELVDKYEKCRKEAKELADKYGKIYQEESDEDLDLTTF